MLWLEALEDFPQGPWNGEPVVWISQGPRPEKEVRGHLVRALSAHVLDMPYDRVPLARLASGQPYLAAPQMPWVSSASRGNWSAVAIARCPVGVDIETRPVTIAPPFNLLHPQERACLEKLDGAARDRTFLQFWTAREAYLKSTGRGLDAALALSRAEAAAAGRVKIFTGGRETCLAETRIADCYVASVVTAAAYGPTRTMPGYSNCPSVSAAPGR